MVENDVFCQICHTNFNKPSIVITTECGHTFCYKDCYSKYFDISPYGGKVNHLARPCPMCRTLLSNIGQKITKEKYIHLLQEYITEIDDDFLIINLETT